jgi:hypothetical protein
MPHHHPSSRDQFDKLLALLARTNVGSFNFRRLPVHSNTARFLSGGEREPLPSTTLSNDALSTAPTPLQPSTPSLPKPSSSPQSSAQTSSTSLNRSNSLQQLTVQTLLGPSLPAKAIRVPMTSSNNSTVANRPGYRIFRKSPVDSVPTLSPHSTSMSQFGNLTSSAPISFTSSASAISPAFLTTTPPLTPSSAVNSPSSLIAITSSHSPSISAPLIESLPTPGLCPSSCTPPSVLPFVNKHKLPTHTSLSGTTIFCFEQLPGLAAITILTNSSLLPLLTSDCSVYVDDLPLLSDDFTHMQILYACTPKGCFPVVFAALADRQPETCIRFWQLFLRRFGRFVGNFCPSEISCDFDPKLLKFLGELFPTTRLRGSQYRLTRMMISRLQMFQQDSHQTVSDRVLEFVQLAIELRSLSSLTLPIRYSQLRLQFANLFDCPHFCQFEMSLQTLLLSSNSSQSNDFWSCSSVLDSFQPSIDVLEVQKTIFALISGNLRYEHSLQVLITVMELLWNPERRALVSSSPAAQLVRL